MLASILTARKTAKELISGPMEGNIKEIGEMVNNMVMVSIKPKMDK